MAESSVEDFEEEYEEDISWDEETLREKEAREARLRRLQTRRSIEDWLETKDLREEWGDEFLSDVST